MSDSKICTVNALRLHLDFLSFDISNCDIRLDNVPQDIHVLIPGTCEYVTLHAKRDFTDVIELRSLQWGACP